MPAVMVLRVGGCWKFTNAPVTCVTNRMFDNITWVQSWPNRRKAASDEMAIESGADNITSPARSGELVASPLSPIHANLMENSKYHSNGATISMEGQIVRTSFCRLVCTELVLQGLLA